MPEIVVRAEASADIADTYRFSVERFGHAVAEEYLVGLDAAIAGLADFPELGPLQPGLTPPIRALPYRSHRIYYNFDGSVVTIVRIFHHAMDAAKRMSQG
ncbi:MAG: type II toxin-antitoxin system RelE/ParE family toxin [Novosphingobium sp.]